MWPRNLRSARGRAREIERESEWERERERERKMERERDRERESGGEREREREKEMERERERPTRNTRCKHCVMLSLLTYRYSRDSNNMKVPQLPAYLLSSSSCLIS